MSRVLKVMLPTLQYAAELAFILICVRAFTLHLLDVGTNTRLFGNEYSYLISSGAIAHTVFQKTGAIPLWNPFIGLGEPLLESPFSFMLNPLMAWPVLLLGPLDGPKIAVVMHVAIMAWGGWALAYALRCRIVGRVTLALLLAGSGSMAATVGNGFYQMGLSQAYMPWILAGAIGTFYTTKRWPVVVLAVSTVLILFAGTYWYALPSAIGVTLLAAFAVIRWDIRQPRRVRFVAPCAWRVLIAGVWILGLGAVRLLPQIANSALVAHPWEALNELFSFQDVLLQYFQRQPPTPAMGEVIQHYHYLLPLTFAAGLVVVRLFLGAVRIVVLRREAALRRDVWRIAIPALLMVTLLTIWGMGGTPPMRFLYDAVPFLREWRYVGRMGAAAVVWVGLLAALWLDDIALGIRAAFLPAPVLGDGPESTPQRRPVRWSRAARGLIDGAVTATLLGCGVLIGMEALSNWRSMAGLIPVNDYERAPLAYLRQQHPAEFLPVYTPGFFAYLPHYEFLVRAAFGNPDYRPLGRPTTIGVPEAFYGTPPRYALVIGDPVKDYLRVRIGYQPVPGAPKPFGDDVLFEDPEAPPYMFTTTIDRLTRGDRFGQRLEAFDTLDVTRYSHNVDSIRVQVDHWPLDSVLIVQETSYPGWTATINGTPVIVESIGERIGVKLPNTTPSAEVIFRYRPPLLYQGAAISGVFFILFVLYTLQAERHLPEPIRARLRRWFERRVAGPGRRTWAWVQVQLARSDVFEPKREGRPRP